jgi:hypothetical protein
MNDSLIKKRQLSLKKVLVQHKKSSFSEELILFEHIDYNDGFVLPQQLTKSSVLLSRKVIPLPRKLLRLTLMIRLKLI